MLSLRAVGLHYGQIAFEGLRARPIDGRLHAFRPDLHHRRLVRSLKRLSMPPVPERAFGAGLSTLLEAVAVPSGLEPDWFLYVRPLVLAVDEDWSMSGGERFELHMLAGWAAPAFHDVPRIRARLDDRGRRSLAGDAGVVKVPANYGAAMAAQSRAREVGAHTVLWVTPGSRTVEEFTSMNALVMSDGVLHAPAPGADILDGVVRRTVLELVEAAGIAVSESAIVWPPPDAPDETVSSLLACATATGLVEVAAVKEVGADGQVHTWRAPTQPCEQIVELRRTVEAVLGGRAGEQWWVDASSLAVQPFEGGTGGWS